MEEDLKLALELHPQQVADVKVFNMVSPEHPGRKAQVLRMVPKESDRGPEEPVWYGLQGGSWNIFRGQADSEIEEMYQEWLKGQTQ